MVLTTIDASGVEPAKTPLPSCDSQACLQSLLVSRIEANQELRGALVGRTDIHPLVQASYLAYTQRYPLILSPDVIWLCLTRGLTLHLAANDELRREVLRDDSELVFTAERADFVLGQANPWPALFPAFSKQLAARTGGLGELLAATFSTTGAAERLASELCVTAPLAPHFEWKPPFPGDLVFPDRGIPSLSLLGTPNDWRWLRRRAGMFRAFHVEPWLNELLPVLDHFIAAVEGRPDPLFWRRFFRYENGADELTGWIHVLFPYLRAWPRDHFVPNPWLHDWLPRWEAAEARRNPLAALSEPRGPGLNEVPPALSSAQLRFVDDNRDEHPLELIGGLIGVTQDTYSLALTPEFTWAIVHPEEDEV